MGRRRRTHKQLLNNFKKERRYRNLKAEELNLTLWGICFGDRIHNGWMNVSKNRVWTEKLGSVEIRGS